MNQEIHQIVVNKMHERARDIAHIISRYAKSYLAKEYAKFSIKKRAYFIYAPMPFILPISLIERNMRRNGIEFINSSIKFFYKEEELTEEFINLIIKYWKFKTIQLSYCDLILKRSIFGIKLKDKIIKTWRISI